MTREVSAQLRTETSVCADDFLIHYREKYKPYDLRSGQDLAVHLRSSAVNGSDLANSSTYGPPAVVLKDIACGTWQDLERPVNWSSAARLYGEPKTNRELARGHRSNWVQYDYLGALAGGIEKGISVGFNLSFS